VQAIAAHAHAPKSLLRTPTSTADQQWLYSADELDYPPSVTCSRQPMTLAVERQERNKAVSMLWQIRDAVIA
jgi:hypothetical protein